MDRASFKLKGGTLLPPIELLLPGNRAKLAEIDDPMEMFADRLEWRTFTDVIPRGRGRPRIDPERSIHDWLLDMNSGSFRWKP